MVSGWGHLALLHFLAFAVSLFRSFVVYHRPFRVSNRSFASLFRCFAISLFRSLVVSHSSLASLFRCFTLSFFYSFALLHCRNFALSLFRTCAVSLSRTFVASYFRCFDFHCYALSLFRIVWEYCLASFFAHCVNIVIKRSPKTALSPTLVD